MKTMYQVSMHHTIPFHCVLSVLSSNVPPSNDPACQRHQRFTCTSTKLLCLTLGVLLINKEPTNQIFFIISCAHSRNTASTFGSQKGQNWLRKLGPRRRLGPRKTTCNVPRGKNVKCTLSRRLSSSILQVNTFVCLLWWWWWLSI